MNFGSPRTTTTSSTTSRRPAMSGLPSSTSKGAPSTPLHDITNDMTPRPTSHASALDTYGSPDTCERRRRTPMTATRAAEPSTPTTAPQTRLRQATTTPRAKYHLTNNIPHSAQYLLPELDPAAPPRLTVVLDLDETL
eukprot:PhM_4_TR18822/c0_g1_i1/m.95790